MRLSRKDTGRYSSTDGRFKAHRAARSGWVVSDEASHVVARLATLRDCRDWVNRVAKNHPVAYSALEARIEGALSRVEWRPGEEVEECRAKTEKISIEDLVRGRCGSATGTYRNLRIHVFLTGHETPSGRGFVAVHDTTPVEFDSVPWREPAEITTRLRRAVADALRFADWLVSLRDEFRGGRVISIRELRDEIFALREIVLDESCRMRAKRYARLDLLRDLLIAAEMQSETMRVRYSLTHPVPEGCYCRACHGECRYPDFPDRFVTCDSCGKRVHDTEQHLTEAHRVVCSDCFAEISASDSGA